MAAGTASALGLAACQAPQPVLRVGAITFPGYEFIGLAENLGWLKDQGVRLVEMHSNTDTLRALALGRLEAAAMTLDEALTGLSDGIALRVVAVFDVSAGADVVMAGAPIRKPADLRGKRVGAEGSAVDALMLAAVLEAGGLSAADITKVSVALPRTAEAYLAGEVDAVVTAEPWASQLRKVKAMPIFDSRAIPGRIVDVLAVRSAALDTHAQPLRHLLRAQFRGLAHYQRDPADAAQRLAPRMRVPPSEVTAAFHGLELPDLAANRALMAKDGALARGLQDLARLLHAQGLVPRPVDPGGLLDPRWLEGL